MKKFLAVLFSVVILATFMAIPTLALGSPSGDVYHTVEIEGGDTIKVKDGDSVTLKITGDEDEFKAWVIEGDYRIVSGDETSKEFVIIPLTDLYVEETYETQSGEEIDKEENESDKAPQTGNETIMLVTLLTAGAFVAMLATKKAVRS